MRNRPHPTLPVCKRGCKRQTGNKSGICTRCLPLPEPEQPPRVGRMTVAQALKDCDEHKVFRTDTCEGYQACGGGRRRYKAARDD